jgi:hypothetical protein
MKKMKKKNMDEKFRNEWEFDEPNEGHKMIKTIHLQLC